jgi:TrmH family RNA methyltransferase
VTAPVITSLTNPLVKEARALATKKGRAETGLFLGEGLKLVTDALDGGWPVARMIHAAGADAERAIAAAARRVTAAGGDVTAVGAQVLQKITRRDNPQTVVGVFRQRLAALADVTPAPRALWVVLEAVRDPGNLGTIVRTVDGVGASGVILVGETCDPFSVEAVRATMGSLFHVPLVRAALPDLLAWRGRWRGTVVGTHLAGTVDYRAVDGAAPTLLVMGGEQRGLTDALAAACDTLVRIPMAGKADSLNLAVATGVMLYRLREGRLGSSAVGSRQ